MADAISPITSNGNVREVQDYNYDRYGLNFHERRHVEEQLRAWDRRNPNASEANRENERQRLIREVKSRKLKL
jgi:hypothetical protein